MAIRDDILTLKNKEGTLAGNKVCNFAYDDTAFEDDTTTGANGVSIYNYNNHNNIPVKDIEVLKVNPTIISKGFRSQVSTLSRMLLNHIFGRVSYNLNKTVDTFNSLLTNLYTYIGQPNGLATLDNTGRLPYSQLPLSAVEYKGAWNANTNTPTLASGTGTFGDEYIVSTQGTRNIGEGSITYRVGDRVIYNGSIWQRIPASSVRTVNSKAPDANGNVTVNASDIVTPDVYGYDRSNIGKNWQYISNSYYSVGMDYGNGRWVACDYFNGLIWSDDGITWTPCTGFSGSRFSCIHYANGIWVAGDGDGDQTRDGLWWSVDGKAWSQGTGGFGNYACNCVYFYNGIWVAGSNEHGLWWSTDGKAWTQSSTATTITVTYVYGNEGRWFACDSDGGAWTSIDGKSWTVSNIPNYICSYIYYNNGLWLACSNGIYWSTDGITWTRGTGDESQDFERTHFGCVNYANGIWIAGWDTVGSLQNYHPIWWSNDGKAWSRALIVGSNTPQIINNIYFINNLWLIVATDGMWLSETNYIGEAGKHWSLDNQYQIKVIKYNEGIAVGAGVSGIVDSMGTSTNNVKAILDWLLYAVDNLLD